MSTDSSQNDSSAAGMARELEQTRAALQSLIHSAHFGVHRFELADDGALIFVDANETAGRMFSIGDAPLRGTTIEQAFPMLAATALPEAYKRVAREGGIYDDEQVFFEDRRISCGLEIHAFQSAPRQVAVLFHDVTERLLAREALQRKTEELEERQQLLAGIFRAAPVGIGMSILRVIKESNHRLSEMTGYSREELLDMPTRRFYATEEEYARVGRILGESEDTQGVGFVETRWLKKDGSFIDIFMGTAPLSPGNRAVGVSFTVLDITERRRAEAERQALELRMLQTQKLESLGVLAGGIAHDFNNILMAVLGHADLAQGALPPASPARENIMEIEKAARRAADLCRQMLAYSGKGRFVIASLDINDVVHEMEEMLLVSMSKKAALRFSFSPGIPPVEADATQLRQIVMNLVINASEALQEAPGVISLSTGTITCDRAYLRSLSLEEGLPEGRYVFLEVADTGKGMGPETQKRIFEPFFTTKFTGRGLGLAAVLGIVRGHKGGIKVYSEEGKGSTFKILFPAGSGPVTPAEAPLRAGKWRGSGAILLADDEESVRNVGRQMLERLGFTVLLATNGRHAIEVFTAHRNQVTCILMDLTMPEMDGEEAFREIRRIDPHVPVLLSSGYNEQEAVQRFVGKGLAGFLQKPYQLAMLEKKLRDVFSPAQ